MTNFVPFEVSTNEMNQMVGINFCLGRNLYFTKFATSLFKLLQVFTLQIMCHALRRAKLF